MTPYAIDLHTPNAPRRSNAPPSRQPYPNHFQRIPVTLDTPIALDAPTSCRPHPQHLESVPNTSNTPPSGHHALLVKAEKWYSFTHPTTMTQPGPQ
ncbi:hypothetical protein OG21DRAFT_1513837 [Imleria badia]|nr:hypothetical protein OG21DRAFT_1513837 [Imleria badia]